MKYADRVERWAGEAVDAWEIHEIAAARIRAGEDIFLLSVGNTDFASPEAAVEEAHASLLRGRTAYANMVGELPLREAIAKRQQQRTGITTNAEQVIVTQGAQNALYNVAQCLLDPGCEVVVPEPMYVTYPATIEGTGAKLVSVPSRAENNFHPTAEDMAAAITDKTRAIFLATPNNPTGAVYTRGELEAIAALCVKHDLWLVSDEVYGLLTYGVDHVSAATLDGMAARTIVIESLSKSHAMAGWRLGWALVTGFALVAYIYVGWLGIGGLGIFGLYVTQRMDLHGDAPDVSFDYHVDTSRVLAQQQNVRANMSPEEKLSLEAKEQARKRTRYLLNTFWLALAVLGFWMFYKSI